jgi:hypothetical protein
MTQDTRYYQYQWYTDQHVGAFLTQEQLDTIAQEMVLRSQTSTEFPSTLEAAKNALLYSWTLVNNFYIQDDNLWQFNGTGAALVQAVNREETSSAATIQYDEVTATSPGLLTVPLNGSTAPWTESTCNDYLGYDLVGALSNTLESLVLANCDAEDALVCYEDGTVYFGAELQYQSPDDSNDFLLIAFNKDHSVTLENTEFEIGAPNNTIGDTEMWLGHSLRYWGAFDDPDTETDDCYYASFQLNGIHYVVLSDGLDETQFLAVLSCLSKVT